MEDYKIRALVEHFELNKKLIKLNNFVTSKKFDLIEDTEQGQLLMEQKAVMEEYLSILGKRLELWLND